MSLAPGTGEIMAFSGIPASSPSKSKPPSGAISYHPALCGPGCPTPPHPLGLFALSPPAPVPGPPCPLPSILPPDICTLTGPRAKRRPAPYSQGSGGLPTLQPKIPVGFYSWSPSLLGVFTFVYLHVPCLGHPPMRLSAEGQGAPRSQRRAPRGLVQ